MIKANLILAACCLAFALPAKSAKLEGRDAAVLLSLLNESGVLTTEPAGQKEKDAGAKLFAGMFDGAACGTNEFKGLSLRLQGGRITCNHSNKAVWDVTCILQGRGANIKTVTEKGRNAAHILRLLENAKAASKPNPGGAGPGGDGTTTSVNSLDCQVQGFNLCKGVVACDFP